MSKEREALKLALEALEEYCKHGAIFMPLTTRDAIREALAEQPAQPSKPLTDMQIRKLWSDAHNDTTDRMAFQVFARLVESAHNIGDEA